MATEQPGPESPAYLEALGRTIKVMRIDAKLERKELAEDLGISYSYLSAIENGQKGPSSRLLYGIATALGIEDHDLVAAARQRLADEAPPAFEAGVPPGSSPIVTAPPPAPAIPAAMADSPVVFGAAPVAAQAPAARATTFRRRASRSNPRDSAKRELRRLVDDMDEEDAGAVLEVVRRLTRRPPR